MSCEIRPPLERIAPPADTGCRRSGKIKEHLTQRELITAESGLFISNRESKRQAIIPIPQSPASSPRPPFPTPHSPVSSLHSPLPAIRYRLSANGSRFSIPESSFPSPHSRVPIPDYRLPAVGCRLSAFRFPIPDSRVPSWLFKSFKKTISKFGKR